MVPSSCRDATDDLVPENERQSVPRQDVATRETEIGVAKTTGIDLDDDVFHGALGDGQRSALERFSRRRQDVRFCPHVLPPTLERESVFGPSHLTSATACPLV
jgi:hypothetical protein